MKDIPIPTHQPRRLPTPQVKTAIVQQAVDLKPAGATVAITTISDNPYEARQPVRVVTQASGGMAAAAPPPRPSRGLMHSFLPGLGETKTAEVSEDTVNWKKEGANAFSSVLSTFGTREERKLAEQQARIREADARIAATRSAGSVVRRGILDTSIDLFGMKVNVPMLLAGGGLLAFALMRRKKRKGRK